MSQSWFQPMLPFEELPKPEWILDPLEVNEDKCNRCKCCGVILDDYNLLSIGYCSSECEREIWK